MPANNANFTGKAAYWGVGVGTALAGTNLATLLIQSADFIPEATRGDIFNEKGETVGLAFANQKQTLRVEGVVYGTGLADAKAQVLKTPPPGEVITITETDDTEFTALNAAKWVCTEAQKTKRVNDMVRMSLTLEQFVANDVAATVGA